MKMMPLYRFARLVARPLVFPFIPYKVKNRERCPDKGGLIICANHVSMSDAPRLACVEKRQIYFMAKSELFQNKFLGFLLKKLGAFPIQRGKGDVGAIDHAGNLLENGGAMGIFLEGTRSKDGSLGQPKAGAVMLAHKYGVPILPVCITPVGSPLPRLFHRVIISYGELVNPAELGIEKGSGQEFRAASRALMERIEALRNRDLERTK